MSSIFVWCKWRELVHTEKHKDTRTHASSSIHLLRLCATYIFDFAVVHFNAAGSILYSVQNPWSRKKQGIPNCLSSSWLQLPCGWILVRMEGLYIWSADEPWVSWFTQQPNTDEHAQWLHGPSAGMVVATTRGEKSEESMTLIRQRVWCMQPWQGEDWAWICVEYVVEAGLV